MPSSILASPATSGLLDPGIDHITMRVKLTPRRGTTLKEQQRAILRLTAEILRFCSGDAVLTPQDARSALSRRDGQVRVDPGQAPHGWPVDGEFGSDEVLIGETRGCVLNQPASPKGSTKPGRLR